jgi:hypothetical protein
MRALSALALCVFLCGCMAASTQKAQAKDCGVLVCSKLSQVERDLCLMKLSQDCNDSTLCAAMADRQMEYSCGLKHGQVNPATCGGIADSGKRAECYSAAAELRLDSKVCEAINDTVSRGMCVSNVAWKTGNRTLCNVVTSPDDLREFCFGVADRDGRACSDIGRSELRITCVEWTTAGSFKTKT